MIVTLNRTRSGRPWMLMQWISAYQDARRLSKDAGNRRHARFVVSALPSSRSITHALELSRSRLCFAIALGSVGA